MIYMNGEGGANLIFKWSKQSHWAWGIAWIGFRFAPVYMEKEQIIKQDPTCRNRIFFLKDIQHIFSFQILIHFEQYWYLNLYLIKNTSEAQV